MDRPTSDNRPWLAVGDAVVTLDLIAGQGICLAIQLGEGGPHAVVRYLDGQTSALHHYHATVAHIFKVQGALL